MKKLSMMLLVIMLTATTAHAGDIGQGMADRVVRGFTNLITGFVEFPVQIYKGYNNGFEYIENEPGSKLVGTVLGIFRGTSHAIGRTGWGGLELFGFWAASPESNSNVGVPLDAEYAWEEGIQYSIFDPNLSEGLEPVVNKLGRGLGNGFLGIAEFPGQIMKGADEGNVGIGIVKGVWYTLSREVYGFGQVFSFILPNPEDNLGHSFEEKWPWDALSSRAE